MDTIKFTDEDLKVLSKLRDEIPHIIKLFQSYQFDLKQVGLNEGVKRKILSEGAMLGDLEYYIELSQQGLVESSRLYISAIDNWNFKMRNVLNKYSYYTLREFLNKNNLQSNEQPPMSLSITIKQIADELGIPRYELLLSGKPKFVNTYPENFLKTFFIL